MGASRSEMKILLFMTTFLSWTILFLLAVIGVHCASFSPEGVEVAQTASTESDIAYQQPASPSYYSETDLILNYEIFRRHLSLPFVGFVQKKMLKCLPIVHLVRFEKTFVSDFCVLSVLIWIDLTRSFILRSNSNKCRLISPKTAKLETSLKMTNITDSSPVAVYPKVSRINSIKQFD